MRFPLLHAGRCLPVIGRALLAAAVPALVAACAAAASPIGRSTSERSSPATSSVPLLPLPTVTVRHLPAGSFYLLGGPHGAPPPWSSIWVVSRRQETLLTRGALGRQIEGFGTAPPGVVVSDAGSLTSGLARWTRRGPVWLHPAGHRRWNIVGLLPDISPGGDIVYMLPPHENGATTVWTRPSWKGADRILYRWQHAEGPIMPVFGPHGMIALIAAGPPPKQAANVIIVNSHGTVVRRLRAGTASLWGGIWGPVGPLVIRFSSGQGELLFLNGRHKLLPAHWEPLAVNPAGQEILMLDENELGLWRKTGPKNVERIGPISRGFSIWQADWVNIPART